MKWTKEILNKFIELYPNNTNIEISNIFNITKNSVDSKARKLKLYKNKEIRTKINQEHGIYLMKI